MKYFKKIIGERVYLSPINLEDVEVYTKWINDYEVAKGIGQFNNIFNIEIEKEFLNKSIKERYNFAMILKDEDRLIGNISLSAVDFINKTAELGIFIGEESDRNKGYGTEAIKLILDYGFNYLNLNNIMLIVYSYNEKAKKSYEKIGFEVFGVWKDSKYFNGKYYDEIYMQLLKDDFNKQK